MDSRTVYHLWANRSKPKATAGNVSFVGDCAYSYGRCIARLDTNERGTIALFGTAGRDSSTTAKHQSYARSAALHIPQMAVPNYHPRDAEDHLQNLQAVLADYTRTMERVKRARVNGPYLEERALQLARDFDIYAVHFGRRERFSEDAAKKLQAAVARSEAKLKKIQEEQAKRRDEELVQALKEWRANKLGYLYGLSFTALRLSKDKQNVETSNSADIPVADAKKLWPVIQRVMRGEKDYEPGTPLGHYRLTKIRKDGSIVVGCHDIAFKEIEGIAGKLGLK